MAAQKSAAFFDAVLKQGVTLCEPMGELCAGLEACLRNGIQVSKYLYLHPDALASKMTRHRLAALSDAHPQHNPLEAWRDAFETMPQHVSEITASDLPSWSGDRQTVDAHRLL